MATLGNEDFAAMFRTPPAKAVAAWKKRAARILPTKTQLKRADAGLANPDAKWAYQDMLWNAHSRAFFVARVAKAEVLDAIHTQVQAAMDEGIPFEEFRNRLQPQLQSLGWWSGEGNQEGKALVRNIKTGEDEWTRLGTPRRLRTIYDTNLSVNYSSGHYQQLKAAAALLPWWRYVAIMDKRTRPPHAALHDHVWKHDDPAWASIWPPNGWRCRCRVEPCTEEEAGDPQYTRQDAAALVTERRRVGKDGPMVDVVGVRAANGQVVFPDAAWAYNPGLHNHAIEDLAWEKVKALPERAQKTFVDSVAKDKGFATERRKGFEAWVQGVQDSGKFSTKAPQTMAAGWLPSDILAKASKLAETPTSPVVAVTDERAWHARRPSKDDDQKVTLEQFLDLPEVLSGTGPVDWHKESLLFYGAPYERDGKKVAVRYVIKVVDGEPSLATTSVVRESEINKSGLVVVRPK